MNQSRQLAAIMFADIMGFTSVMETDERLAHGFREKLNASLKQNVDAHNGRIVKYTGDGALCLFGSAVEAVLAAIQVQLEMKTEPVVPLRIGIHSGDVMQDDVDIYGDGVNIASRVESFAIAGGIFISDKIYHEISNHADIHTVSLGMYNFKNVKEPIGLYAISNAGIAIPRGKLLGKGRKTFLSGRAKSIVIAFVCLVIVFIIAAVFFFNTSTTALQKSVAVMPFKNLTNEQENDFFTDGITEDVLTQVSKISDLNVISNSTMMLFKNSKKTIKEIGEELHAGTVLEGSVRRLGTKIRIFTQLTDVATSKSIWTETFDRDFSKIFDIQSEIAQEIANKLKAKLSVAEKERINRKQTDNLSAYEFYLKGRSHYYQYKSAENELAITEYKKAIELDPSYTLAWAGLGDAYSQKHNRFGFDISWIDSSKQAGLHAIQLDSTSSEAFKALANAYNYAEQYDSGFLLLQKAVHLNPNNAPAVGNLGTGYFLKGELDNALIWEKKAAALNPKNAVPFMIIGWTYRLLNDLENAKLWLNKSLELKPFADCYRELGYTYLLQGKKADALNLIPLAISIDSSNTRTYESAGMLAQMAGDTAKAKYYYQKSIELNDAISTDVNAVAPIGLGQLLIAENKIVDAEIYLSRALRLNIDNSSKSQDDDNRINIAAVYAIRNQKTEALAWLQKAVEVNWVDYNFTELNPWFDNIRNDPRYRQIVDGVKRKVAAMLKNAKESS